MVRCNRYLIGPLRRLTLCCAAWCVGSVLSLASISVAYGPAAEPPAFLVWLSILLPLLFSVPVGNRLEQLIQWSWAPKSLDPARITIGDIRESVPFMALRFFGSVGSAGVLLGGSMIAAEALAVILSNGSQAGPLSLIGGLLIAYSIQVVAYGSGFAVVWELARLANRVRGASAA